MSLEAYLKTAKQTLLQNNLTNVLYDGNEIIKSTRRGVAPLLEYIDSKRDYSGFVGADKVTGKAAAFLYVLLGIKVLYTGILSEPALKVLQENGIYVQYDSLVPLIKNRKGDGLCPMEQSVLDIENATDALPAIKEKLASIGVINTNQKENNT